MTDKTIQNLKTTATYKIENRTAIVESIFKEKNAPDINTILVKLMQTDIEKTADFLQ